MAFNVPIFTAGSVCTYLRCVHTSNLISFLYNSNRIQEEIFRLTLLLDCCSLWSNEVLILIIYIHLYTHNTNWAIFDFCYLHHWRIYFAMRQKRHKMRKHLGCIDRIDNRNFWKYHWMVLQYILIITLDWITIFNFQLYRYIEIDIFDGTNSLLTFLHFESIYFCVIITGWGFAAYNVPVNEGER